MSLLLLIVLMFFNTYYIFKKKYKRSFVLSVANIGFILILSTGFLSQMLLDGLQKYPALTHAEWKNENLIVLLTSGSLKWSSDNHYTSQVAFYPRQYEAAKLYSNCKKYAVKCRILISGGDPALVGKAESEIAKEELMKLDIPSSDILTETKSLNTYENAAYSSQIIRTFSPETQIYLVTSGTHMRRSLKSFSFFKVYPTAAPADFIVIKKSWKHLYQNIYFADLTLHEYIGYFKVILQDITAHE